MKPNRVILLLFALLVQNVQAFYNPSTGRWLSRDPIVERGAKMLSKGLHDPRVPPGVRFDPSKPWKICCRPVNIGGLGWLTHCDHRQGPCDTPDSVEFPISRDTGCCKIKSDREMSQCLNDNKNDAGHGIPGSNCQTSSDYALKKCCAKSSWTMSWYASVPCGDLPPVYFPPLGF